MSHLVGEKVEARAQGGPAWPTTCRSRGTGAQGRRVGEVVLMASEER
jgi:hypothetical protein